MRLQTMEELRLFARHEPSRLLYRIRQFLAEEGVRSYVVGGFVRDIMLGRDTADIDIAVSADALDIAARAATALGGRYVPLDEVNGVGRVVLMSEGNLELDFTTLKGDIKQDLAQRDFTIDAMAIELEGIAPDSPDAPAALHPEGLIDPFRGHDDLRQRVIRAVSESAFRSDAARLIRAVRLAAELGFTIDSDTEALIRQHSRLIADVASERVREELMRLLAMPQAGQSLAYLDSLGILTSLIPELEPARGVSQPWVHVWDVFEHSIQTVAAIEFMLREGGWEHNSPEVLAPVPWSEKLREHFDHEVSHGSTRRSLLKLAALLHDVAKPQTKTVDEDGRARFLGHPKEGAATAAAILERLRFSAREIKLVELEVRHHLRPTQLSRGELPTRRAIYRYFRDTGEAAIDILYLCLADHLAARGATLDSREWQEHADSVAYMLNKHFEEASLTTPPKLLDGHDLIDSFGMEPGPGIGEVLEAVREAQAAGEVSTHRGALSYAKKMLADRGRKASRTEND